MQKAIILTVCSSVPQSIHCRTPRFDISAGYQRHKTSNGAASNDPARSTCHRQYGRVLNSAGRCTASSGGISRRRSKPTSRRGGGTCTNIITT
jgi:hypothetical protein